MNDRKKRIAVIAGLLFTFVGFANPSTAVAGDWVFRRSYHTHEVPRHLRSYYPEPVSRSAYRPAIIGGRFGYSVQSGYRFNRIIIRSGNSTDITTIREGWYRER